MRQQVLLGRRRHQSGQQQWPITGTEILWQSLIFANCVHVLAARFNSRIAAADIIEPPRRSCKSSVLPFRHDLAQAGNTVHDGGPMDTTHVKLFRRADLHASGFQHLRHLSLARFDCCRVGDILALAGHVEMLEPFRNDAVRTRLSFLLRNEYRLEQTLKLLYTCQDT